MATKSTTKGRGKKSKQQKPYPEFPLTAHPSGRWCKKRRGRQFYFGPIDDWAAALKRYEREWPVILETGAQPTDDSDDVHGDGCSLMRLCNAFLTSKRNKMLGGELSETSFRDYHRVTDLLIDTFGKQRRVNDLRPDDFERLRKSMATRLGPVSLKNEINRVRVVLKYAHDQRLIDQPVNFGQSFNRPSAKMIRKSRNEAGPRLFTRDELVTILAELKADSALRAMVLLGLNCGFGNTDVASLPQSAVDLDSGWVDFPRPKTEVERRVPLWPETVESLRKAIECRPDAKDDSDAGLCFITIQGNRWVRTKLKQTGDNPHQYVTVNTVGARFRRVLKRLHINGRRGLGFYTLRHVFATIAGESRDQVAVNAIMGHVDDSMAGQYREGISDDRLRAVVNVVRDWLFGHG